MRNASRWLCFALVFLFSMFSESLLQQNELPDCNNVPQKEVKHKELFIVSTLDGKVSALDPLRDGEVIWSTDTGPGALMESSLSKLEMRSRGQFVRLIPSLDGTLYRFTGDVVEPLPITADFLLRGSFKLGDDLVVTGGRETRTYGLNVHTGRVQYVCTMGGGCNGSEDGGGTPGEEDAPKSDPRFEDILVIKRNTQTVRAVEPRTGREKWNFSVGEHELSYLPSMEGCQASITETASALPPSRPNLDEHNNGGFALPNVDYNDNDDDLVRNEDDDSANIPVVSTEDESENVIQVIVPDGTVLSRERSSDTLLWTVQFPSPVVHAWHLRDGALRVVDLFDQKRLVGLESDQPGTPPAPPTHPILYVGIHQNQLYVQHSSELRTQVQRAAMQYQYISDLMMPRVDWKPYLATAPSRTPIINAGRGLAHASVAHSTGSDASGSDKAPIDDLGSKSKALVVRHDIFDYPYDTGYYLYESPVLDSEAEKTLPAALVDPANYSVDETEGEESFEQYIIVSLWYWWREVAAISLVTSVLVHVVVTWVLNRLRRTRLGNAALPEPDKTGSETGSNEVAALMNASNNNNTRSHNNNNSESVGEVADGRDSVASSATSVFRSRYLDDFEPIQCLGQGGFGIVLQSKNRIDDCSYAVKRIRLPNSKEARDKVLREVKALAKLDHANIVRYFQAWLETPPGGWQEEQDDVWKKSFGRHQNVSSDEGEGVSSLEWNLARSVSTTAPSSTGAGGHSATRDLGEIKRQASENVFPKKVLTAHNPFKPFETSMGFSLVESFNEPACEISEANETSASGPGLFRRPRTSSSSEDGDKGKQSDLDWYQPEDEAFDAPNWDEEDDLNANGDKELDTNSSPPFAAYNSNNITLKHLKSDDDDSVVRFERHSESGDGAMVLSTAGDHIAGTPPIDTEGSTDDKNGRPTSLLAPNIDTEVYLYIQMQLCRKESLKDWLSHHTQKRNYDEVIEVCYQITCAVEYVHLHNLIHRDLKPSNIFFSIEGVVKVGDFGLVTALSSTANVTTPSKDTGRMDSLPLMAGDGATPQKQHTDRVGTQLYMSPEQVSGLKYNQKVDIFSLGLIFFELLWPFDTQMERISMLQNAKRRKFPRGFIRAFKDECQLIRRMLATDAEERPTASEVRMHELFSDVRQAYGDSIVRPRRRTHSSRFSTGSEESHK